MKKIKNYLPKKLPSRFYSRIGACIFYLIGLAQVFISYGKPLVQQYPLIKKIMLKVPVFYFYEKYYNRHLLLILILVTHKLFLKRKEVGDYVIFDTPYFLKHHIYHALLLMINFSLPEAFILEFFGPKNISQYRDHCFKFLMLNIIFYLPCILNAAFGKYNNIPLMSDSVLYFIGDCPNSEEKDGPYLKNVPWISYSYWKGGRYGKRATEGIEDEDEDEDDDDDQDDDDDEDDDD